MVALDTNVLIYACDKADVSRQQVALDLVSNAHDGVLLWQVVPFGVMALLLCGLALFIKVFQTQPQDNRFWIALLLPIHAGFAASLFLRRGLSTK